MNSQNQTPLQEALSVITVGSILAAVGCYVGTVQNVPGLAQGVFWVAGKVYGYCPALKALHGAQIPILVGSATIGLAVFFFGVPWARFLAAQFAKAQLAYIERSAGRFKKNRARWQKKERAKDEFIVQ